MKHANCSYDVVVAAVVVEERGGKKDISLAHVLSRSKDLDETRAVVANGTASQVGTARETAHLMTAGGGHAINLAVATDNARISAIVVVATAAARSGAPGAHHPRAFHVAKQVLVGAQTGRFGKFVKTRVVPPRTVWRGRSVRR